MTNHDYPHQISRNAEYVSSGTRWCGHPVRTYSPREKHPANAYSHLRSLEIWFPNNTQPRSKLRVSKVKLEIQTSQSSTKRTGQPSHSKEKPPAKARAKSRNDFTRAEGHSELCKQSQTVGNGNAGCRLNIIRNQMNMKSHCSYKQEQFLMIPLSPQTTKGSGDVRNDGPRQSARTQP